MSLANNQSRQSIQSKSGGSTSHNDTHSSASAIETPTFDCKPWTSTVILGGFPQPNVVQHNAATFVLDEAHKPPVSHSNAGIVIGHLPNKNP
ncbi:MAG: hypothetical protein ACRCV6_10010 [Formosimonas sp.]